MNNFDSLKDNIKLYIASKVLQIPKESLIFGFTKTIEMEKIAIKYLNGKPLSKIFNEKYFWNHCFYTNQYTLDPRPSTEKIIEELIKNHDQNKKFTFLELGTGTGALCGIILSLFPNAICTTIEISKEAIEVAKVNLKSLGVINRCEIIENDWLYGIEKHFDILVSNPPYISIEEYELNQDVLQYDPLISLVCPDPLEMYRKIAEKENLFNEIYLEIPPKRQKKIRKLFTKKVYLCY